jgi:hypothetical protein
VVCCRNARRSVFLHQATVPAKMGSEAKRGGAGSREQAAVVAPIVELWAQGSPEALEVRCCRCAAVACGLSAVCLSWWS